MLRAVACGHRSGAVVMGLLLIALVSGGCGGSHHSGPSDLTISDLQVFQNPATHTVALQATFVDHDVDLFNGTCNISTNLGSVSIPINQAAPGIAPNTFKPGLTGTALTGNMSVTDTGGHVSNSLPFSTSIPEQLRGTISDRAVASIGADSARIGH
jgi:hypothetical protein